MTRDAHILDRLSAVFRHRRLAITVFLFVVIVMLLQSYSTIPMYQARARLLIQDERTTSVVGLDADDPMFWQDPGPYYETQYRILQSRGLARRVVNRLDLEQVPEFNGQGPRQLSPLAAIRSARTAVFASVRSLLPDLGEPAVVDPPTPDETAEERAQVAAFLERVQVLPVRSTRLVDVTFQAADPQFAARAINTHAEEYVQQNLDLRLQSTDNTLAWLGEELKKQQQKVEDSERALAEYREAQNALSLEDRQNIVVARLTQLNDAVTRAELVRVQKEGVYNQVRSLDPTSEATALAPAIARNQGVQDATARLADLQAEKVRLSGRYGERHPTIVKINASLENASRQLRTATVSAIDSIRNEYRSARLEEQRLQSQLEAQKRTAMDLDRKNVGYTVLQREAESNRNVYEALLQREKEFSVISNSKANNVQLMDRAEVPEVPFTPNRRRDWFLATLIGLVASLGLVFGLEYIDDTVKTPEDIARKVKLPLLGLVPAVRGERMPMLSDATPHDFGEAFRSLRTSLVFTSGGEATRIIAVTSTQPLEGKTTTACNLAMVLAVGGARVLLVDADMRRPSLHKILRMKNSLGLSQVLVGQTAIRDAIQKTHDPNLFALPAGRIPPNPSELLASDRMTRLLAKLATGPFDWVLLDTPPILAVTDAVVVSPAVSAVAFVIGADMTRVAHCERALEMLRSSSQARVIGAILNRVDFDRNRYYYSRYYGYHYKSYYGQAPTAA